MDCLCNGSKSLEVRCKRVEEIELETDEVKKKKVLPLLHSPLFLHLFQYKLNHSDLPIAELRLERLVETDEWGRHHWVVIQKNDRDRPYYQPGRWPIQDHHKP